MVRLWDYAKPSWRRLALALLCMGVEAVCVPLMIWTAKELLPPILQSGQSQALRRLDLVALAVLALGLLKGLASYGHYYLGNYVGQRVIQGLRGDLFWHLLRLSPRFFEETRSGKLISYLTNDVAVLQQVLSENIAQVLVTPLMALGTVVLMFLLSWRLTLLVLLGAPLLAWVLQQMGRKMRRVTERMQQRLADLTSLFQEVVLGIRIVQCFNAEERERQRFGAENERTFAAIMKGHQLQALMTPAIEWIGLTGMLLLLWFGGREVILAQRMGAEDLIALLGSVQVLITQMRKFGRLHLILQQGRAAGQRILEVLDLPPEIPQKPNAIALPDIQGHIQFDHVSFQYSSGEMVLHDISFEVRPGEVVAIAGPSGAGKTTLANLIPRLYDVTSGSVRVEGYDVRDWDLASLRSHIGIVPQEVLLFTGTVRENIAYGQPEASDEEVEWAARMAYAHEFIVRLPQGYQTWVGERGAKLSRGQCQRIAIARALLRNPRILILDEATSALDSESEALVQKALERLMEGRTTLIIAHRLSSIRHAHRILILDQGRIVEEGSHEELLGQGGLYSKLYELQSLQARGEGLE